MTACVVLRRCCFETAVRTCRSQKYFPTLLFPIGLALRRAANATRPFATSMSRSSGGTVRIPAGTFLCGPLTLANSVNLQLDSGAILRMLPIDKYPGGTVSPPNFISASGLHDIEISGSGAIDGQGAPWWPYANTN